MVINMKSIFLVLVLLTSCFISEAQSLKAISQSGYEESYSLSNNLTITFDSTAFVFSKGGSILKKWGYGEVIRINYLNVSTRIDQDVSSLQTKAVHVYPQPSKEGISISYHIPEQSPVHLLMYSVDGALISSYDMGVFQQGQHISTMTIPTSIPSGSYILCIQGNTFSYSIPIIHSKGQ